VSDDPRPLSPVLVALQERARELQCLFRVDDLLRDRDTPFPERLQGLATAIPTGFQYPSYCQARVRVRNQVAASPGFSTPVSKLLTPLVVWGEQIGDIEVSYTRQLPEADEGPFLRDERRLVDAIADRVGHVVLQEELSPLFLHSAQRAGSAPPAGRHDWRVLLDMLRATDRSLFRKVSRKLLNYLAYNGVGEATSLLSRLGSPAAEAHEEADDNRPSQRSLEGIERITGDVFRVAAEHLSEQELVSCVQVWIKEDRVSFLVQALETQYTSLVDIANVVERYQHTGVGTKELSTATQMGLKVSLIRRLLSDDTGFVNTCRKFVAIDDFFDLLRHTVILPNSHGRVGGKGSGLFLASRVLRQPGPHEELLLRIRVPKTWYLPSDALVQFFAFNNLDDVYNWKYRDLEQIRQEYPHILQLFKASRFPPEIVSGLSAALDDLGARPLIVRSSSLLEDRLGSAFSGKYKSLFLANQGDKAARMEALLDAVAEVFASVFGPDPIQYRAERGLLDQHEEMGVLIQEVVGTSVGRFFLPTFSGVAASHNEMRWSPRIRREDGLLRMVPGLGTRAVDRLSDDYPVLIAPGQPNLRVNVTPESVVRCSPQRADVIDLASNAFRTVDRQELLGDDAEALPGLADLVSVYDGERIRALGPLDAHGDGRELVFTFEGLFTRTPFLATVRALLSTLRDAMGTPVEIEFAFDGQDLFLLQCRPQGHAPSDAPAAIPRDVPPSQVVFTARRYVSNGTIPDLTHVVYIDPDAYTQLPDLPRLRDVGRAVGRLNKILPRRKFALLGPGRWGSRGDIRLGVSVTYSDINNTALLVEIARARGGYSPDLSFGTHFFQDLVESSIRYLPLYPDDPDVVFNEEFLRGAPSSLARLVPDLAHLSEVVRVIDVQAVTGGHVLRVLANADLDEAIGYLCAAPAPAAGRRD
jgi:pyruvate,water dikinase